MFPHPGHADMNINGSIQGSHDLGTDDHIVNANGSPVVNVIIWNLRSPEVSTNSSKSAGQLGRLLIHCHPLFLCRPWKGQPGNLGFPAIEVIIQQSGKSKKHFFTASSQDILCLFLCSVNKLVKKLVVVIGHVFLGMLLLARCSLRPLFGCLGRHLRRLLRLHLGRFLLPLPFLVRGRRWYRHLIPIIGRSTRCINQNFKGCHHRAKGILRVEWGQPKPCFPNDLT